MDISTEDIKKFVGTVEELTGMAFELDMSSPDTEDNMDYFNYGLWSALEHYFGISPKDMKAKYKIEKV